MLTASLLLGFAPPDSVLRPPQVLQLANTPPIAVFPQPEIPVVAIRAHAALNSDAPTVLAMRMLQALALPAARGRAVELGARFDAGIDDGVAWFAVEGPARVLEDMVALLRRALASTNTNDLQVSAAHAVERARMLRTLETADARVRARLFAAASGRDTVLLTLPSDFTAAELESSRSALLHKGNLRITIAGGTTVERARMALSGDWDAAPGALLELRSTPDTVAQRARVQVQLPVTGRFFRSDAEPALLLVAAEVLDAAMQNTAARAPAAEAWLREDARGIALFGSVVAPDINALVAVIDADAVADARARVLQRVVMRTRTPSGLAAYAAEQWDAVRQPAQLVRIANEIGSIDAASVLGLIQGLAAATPVVVEVRP